MGLNVELSRDTRHDHGAPAHGAAGNDLLGAMERAEAVCVASGARLTPIRRRVFETLQSTGSSLGAYEIADALADDEGRRLAPITIYRALDFLIAQGLAHRLASHNAYVACRHGHGPGEPVAFLICEDCRTVEERVSPGLSAALSHLLRDARFEPHRKMLEISGRCGRCRPRPVKAA